MSFAISLPLEQQRGELAPVAHNTDVQDGTQAKAREKLATGDGTYRQLCGKPARHKHTFWINTAFIINRASSLRTRSVRSAVVCRSASKRDATVAEDDTCMSSSWKCTVPAGESTLARISPDSTICKIYFSLPCGSSSPTLSAMSGGTTCQKSVATVNGT